MRHLIGQFIAGLIVGAVAKLLTPGKGPGGWIVTSLLGIAGAFVGSWIGQQAGLYHAGETTGFVGSVLGAMLLLFVWKKLFGGE